MLEMQKHLKKHPALILKSKAEPVTEFGPKLRNEVNRMRMVMTQCEGIGLAANQIGSNKAIFVYIYEGKNYACINPRYTEGSVQDFKPKEVNPEAKTSAQETEVGIEGCLSLPANRWVNVPRFKSIKVTYHQWDGNAVERLLEGYEARIFQHEYDHLQGKLITDYEQ